MIRPPRKGPPSFRRSFPFEHLRNVTTPGSGCDRFLGALTKTASWTAARHTAADVQFGRARISGMFAPAPAGVGLEGTRRSCRWIDSGESWPAGCWRSCWGRSWRPRAAAARGTRSRRDRSTRQRASRRRRWGSTPRPIRTLGPAAPMPIARFPDSPPCRVPPVRAAPADGLPAVMDRRRPSSFGTPPPGSPGTGRADEQRLRGPGDFRRLWLGPVIASSDREGRPTLELPLPAYLRRRWRSPRARRTSARIG